MCALDRHKTPRLIRVENAEEAAHDLADEVIDALRRSAPRDHRYVLGLATGRSPQPLYDELVARHRRHHVSFKTLETFNLDEYVGRHGDDPVSFRRWMDTRFFSHLDIPDGAIHFPTMKDRADLGEDVAQAYEKSIRQAGGIDLLILGLGENGHVAFNEPGSSPRSRTRIVDLTESTRRANQRYFPPGTLIPQQAMTMGIATILEAKRLRVLAFGAKKRDAVFHLLEGAVDTSWPCSHLRDHPDIRLFVDAEAASALSPEPVSR